MKATTDMTIEEQLRQTWRQQRRFCHVRGLCRCVVWLVVLGFLGFLIDWGLLFRIHISATVSLLLGIAGLITMVWVVWHDWLKHLCPYDATQIALEVEVRHPELMSSLVSYTQLESISSGTDASPDLLNAMRDYAVEQSLRLKFSDIVDFSQLKKLLIFAVIVLAVAAGLSVRWSEHFDVLLQRLAGIDTAYPIQTKLVEISGDMTVPLGQPVTIVVKAGGVIPDDAILHLRPVESDADFSELPMEKLASGAAFSRELEAADRDMDYFVTMGDCRSEAFRISVVRAPRIVSAGLRMEFPPYLKRPPESTDQLNLEVPEGTRIVWNLRCDKVVGKLGVVCGDRRLDAQIGESGRDVTFSLTADRNFGYAFEWTEGASGKGFQFQDVEYNVKIIKDARPRIVFCGKAPSGPATIGKKAEIRWQAQDDCGLGKIWLVYTVTTPGQSDPAEAQRIELRDAEGRLSDENAYTWTLAKDVPELEPGRQINYHLETADLKPGEKGGRIARSPSRQLSILSSDEYLLWYRRELTARNDAVKAVFLSERDASRQIKQLLVENEGDQP